MRGGGGQYERGPVQASASACGARRALGEGLDLSGVSSAPVSRQGLRLVVPAMERGGREAPIHWPPTYKSSYAPHAPIVYRFNDTSIKNF